MSSQDPFPHLYDDVTAALHKYVDERVTGTPALPASMTAAEGDWFESLIKEFTREFHGWGKSSHPVIKTAVQSYLGLFAHRVVRTELRLAAHVFLHVAFDLPRVIARTPVPAGVSTARLGHVFLGPSPFFLKVFIEFAKGGHLGLLGRLAGGLDATRIAGYWVLALRSQAWIHALLLQELATPWEMELREIAMCKGLLVAAQAAFTTGGFGGVGDLNNADLFAGAPLAFINDWRVEIGTAVVAVGAGAAYVARRRRRRLISQVEVLGTMVFREMARAFQGEGGREPQAELAGAGSRE